MDPKRILGLERNVLRLEKVLTKICLPKFWAKFG